MWVWSSRTRLDTSVLSSWLFSSLMERSIVFPWIYASLSDSKGLSLGSSDGVPTFIDFFRRDSERVNSNMVIVGKSGGGKSYATKSILSNLAADDSKIFVLDPENEYTELAGNLHGKFINVANASQQGLEIEHNEVLHGRQGGGAVPDIGVPRLPVQPDLLPGSQRHA